MKKLILMAAVMLSVLPAAAQEQASKFDASYIQVWGQAEKEITPDEFYLSVTINEKDSKGKISIQTQERAMLDALKKLGVDTQKQLRILQKGQRLGMETVPAQTEHTGTGGAGFRIAQRSGHFERLDGEGDPLATGSV